MEAPKKTVERTQHRRVSYLELFYDLVYVVLIAEVAHHLASHPTWLGVGQSAFLFVLVWLAWLNGTLYHDLHGGDDIRTRVFTFAQMFTVAAMAVFAHGAFGPGGFGPGGFGPGGFGEGAAGFALSFAAFQLILTRLWWSTGVHDPAHRPLARPYSAVFLLSATLFAVSAAVDDSTRRVLWGIGWVLSVSGPFVMWVWNPKDPEVKAELERSSVASHSSVERLDLFTIIVLGEVIVGVVSGVASRHHLDLVTGATAGIGLIVAFALWWLYFDTVADHLPKPGRRWSYFWLLLHLPITMGLVAAGAGMFNVVEHSSSPLGPAVRWLLVGSLSLTMVSVAAAMTTVLLPDEHRPLYRNGIALTLLAAAGTIGLGFWSTGALPLLGAAAGILMLPVGYGLKVWIDTSGGEEPQIS